MAVRRAGAAPAAMAVSNSDAPCESRVVSPGEQETCQQSGGARGPSQGADSLTFLRAGIPSAHDEILPDWLQKGVLRRTIPSVVWLEFPVCEAPLQSEILPFDITEFL